VLARLRTAAQRSVQRLRWDSIAAQTIDVYRDAIARRQAVTGLAT
jgi:hypothetical protein